MTSERTFTTAVEPRKQGGVSIKLPFDPKVEWGDRDRYDVTGSIGGHRFRGKLIARPDGHYLELGPAWCRDFAIKAGHATQVVLAPEGPQLNSLAADISQALDADPQVRRFFEALPTFYRKNFMRWIDQAKRPETRANRIAETVATLRAGKRER
jgi:Bacteriocin-protection, YdeI or OmpD-Associated/Domain of unknown function (DUF1905)